MDFSVRFISLRVLKGKAPSVEARHILLFGFFKLFKNLQKKKAVSGSLKPKLIDPDP
jgi:hypothetical protein